MDSRLLEIFRELAPIPGLSGQERLVADYIHSFMRHIGLNAYEDSVYTVWNGDAGKSALAHKIHTLTLNSFSWKTFKKQRTSHSRSCAIVRHYGAR